MINQEFKIVLTYNIRGGKTANCQVKSLLGDKFVNGAVTIKEGRPNKKRYPVAHKNWIKMSFEERLEWHLYSLVHSRNGRNMKYELI